jgi:predicted kinase
MNSRITVLVGISGSGKSTWAHKEWAKDPINVVIVNRDSIIQALFGFTEETIKDFYKHEKLHSLEKEVTRYEDTMIQEALASGKDVIVDATHLRREYLERFKYWNVTTEIKTFVVGPITAITADMKRTRQVGDAVIKKQYTAFSQLFESISKNPIDFTPVTIELNHYLPDCVIFDIDGTLSHITKRSPYEWARVCEDIEDESTVAVLNYLNINEDRPNVVICTGRDGIAEYNTKKWLTFYGIEYDEFHIRAQKDMRPDWVVKEEMWRDLATRYNIIGMFDDRLQVVRRARALGLKVFNVEYNNF